MKITISQNTAVSSLRLSRGLPGPQGPAGNGGVAVVTAANTSNLNVATTGTNVSIDLSVTMPNVAPAYSQANAAYAEANTANTQANAARDQANTAYGQANSAYGQANSAYAQANAAYTEANTANTQANLAYNQANSAYTAANAAANVYLYVGGTLIGNSQNINFRSGNTSNITVTGTVNSSPGNTTITFDTLASGGGGVSTGNITFSTNTISSNILNNAIKVSGNGTGNIDFYTNNSLAVAIDANLSMNVMGGLVVKAVPFDAALNLWADHIASDAHPTYIKYTSNNAVTRALVGFTNSGSNNFQITNRTSGTGSNVKIIVNGGNQLPADFGQTIVLFDANTVITANNYLKTTASLFANLPSAATAGAGARAFITDGNTVTFLAVVGGGAGNSVPIVSNGTSWLVG